MNNYRDDIQETIVASGGSFGGIAQLVSENVTIRDNVLNNLVITDAETLHVGDEFTGKHVIVTTDIIGLADSVIENRHSRELVTDTITVAGITSGNSVTTVILTDEVAIQAVLIDGNTSALIVDNITVSDAHTGVKSTSQLIVDTLTVSDATVSSNNPLDMVDDSVIAIDSVFDRVTGVILDNIVAHDVTHDTRHTLWLVEDIITVTDRPLNLHRDDIDDSVQLLDMFTDKMRATIVLNESLLADDSLVNSGRTLQIVDDAASVVENYNFALRASQLVGDTIFIDDETNNVGSSAAWSSDIRAWAMSQYTDFPYHKLVVIDGTLYGANDTGVYRLDHGTQELITAHVRTGPIDLTGETLTHPLGAYLEYALSNGSMSVDVTTTQSGLPVTYNYILPPEQSERLTNGRVLFGRGLRGRHFEFKFNIVGNRGHVNDLNIDLSATKRRV